MCVREPTVFNQKLVEVLPIAARAIDVLANANEPGERTGKQEIEGVLIPERAGRFTNPAICVNRCLAYCRERGK